MTYPKQAPPIQRPNPLRPESLFRPHEALDMDNRMIITRIVEDLEHKDPVTGKYLLKEVKIASGRRLVGVRVDLMHGSNHNDPSPYQPRTYGQLKSS